MQSILRIFLLLLKQLPMIATLFVAHLTPEEIVTLKELHSYHPKPADELKLFC